MQQREDGTWANFERSGRLSTTVEAYAALGSRATRRMPCTCVSARLDHRPWRIEDATFTDVDGAVRHLVGTTCRPAPESVFFPRWFPLNPYDFGCWARQTIFRWPSSPR
jgi:squalene-hopene/tetraprenyl-beta-curcumene cyclase